jgi:hypothetical protein
MIITQKREENRTVQPGDAFEDTGFKFKHGFEIVKF